MKATVKVKCRLTESQIEKLSSDKDKIKCDLFGLESQTEQKKQLSGKNNKSDQLCEFRTNNPAEVKKKKE